MYKKLAKNILMFLVYFSPVLFVVGPMFLTKGYLFFTDLVWGPNIALSWTSSTFLVDVVTKGLSFVLSVSLIEKLYITLCLGLALWGGRKIAELFLKQPGLVFVASLFALFNPFVYDRAMYGQFGIVGGFGLMLLGTGFLLEYLEKRQTRQILFAALSFAFAIQFAPQFLFFIAAFYIFVFLPMFFTREQKTAGDGIKTIIIKIVKISIILAVIAFALNANWIIGSLTGKSAMGEFISTGITRQDLVAFQTSGKTGGDALGNVLMMSGFWGKDQFRYVDLTTVTNNWGRSFFLLLPLILWGFAAGLRSKEKKYRYMTIGSAFLYIISVILAAGIRIPAGRELTYFLFDHLPFYKGLREAQKWDAVVTMVYLIFLSIGLRELFSKKIVLNNAVVMKVFVAAIIVMQAPLLLFGFGGQVKPVQYPSDWYTVNNYIVHDSGCTGSTLFLPWHLYMSFSWIGRIIANPAPSFFQCPVVSGTDMEWDGISDNSQNPEGQAVENWLTTERSTDLLQNSTFNIQYVILAKEVDWQNYIEIASNPKLQLVMETATLRVYKVIK
jgi:hypothetical protein